jgi:hypothetical protein
MGHTHTNTGTLGTLVAGKLPFPAKSSSRFRLTQNMHTMKEEEARRKTIAI